MAPSYSWRKSSRAEAIPDKPIPAITKIDTINAANTAIKRCVIRQLFHKDAMDCNLNRKKTLAPKG